MKFEITKKVEAKTLEEAIKKEKKTPIESIIKLEEPEENKVGF